MLDVEIKAGLSAKTAAHHWSDLKRLFADAVNCKERGMRVRTTDRSVGVRSPEGGSDKAKTILYPDEINALLSVEGREGSGAPSLDAIGRRPC